MNRLFHVFLVIFSCVVFSACGSSQANTGNESNKEAANYTENEKVYGAWYVEEYKDDFGDSTGSMFVYTMCEGTFENTATSGSDLAVGVYYDSSYNAFLIRLLEYNDTKATYLSSSDITMKCKVDEYIFEDALIGDAPNGDLIISENNKYYKTFYNYLDEGKEIRTIICIDNSKYNFTIRGKGFKEAIDEKAARIESAGISGTYKNSHVTSPDYTDWFTIKQITPTSGTITAASKSGSATLDYIYDPETYILTVIPNADWTYRCSYDRFIVNDVVLVPDSGSVEGEIPDEQYFDATIKWSSDENKATKIYEFKKDGSYTIHGTDYKGEAIETDTGTYTIIDSFLLAKKSSGLVWTYYIFNGKLLNQTPYVIDK